MGITFIVYHAVLCVVPLHTRPQQTGTATMGTVAEPHRKETLRLCAERIEQ